MPANTKCDYCGKIFYKFNSAKKRSKHNFCSQKCYHYFHTKKYKVSDEIFNKYYQKYYKLLLRIANLYDYNYFDELMQIGRITLWGIIGKNDRQRLSLLNLNKYLECACIRQFKIFFRKENPNRMFSFSELKNIEQYEPISYKKFEDKICYGDILCGVLENLLNRQSDISTKILIEREILNNSVDFCCKKYNLSKKQVVSNNCAIKLRLKKQFPNIKEVLTND